MTLNVCLLTRVDYLHCVIMRYITSRIDLMCCDCNSFVMWPDNWFGQVNFSAELSTHLPSTVTDHTHTNSVRGRWTTFTHVASVTHVSLAFWDSTATLNCHCRSSSGLCVDVTTEIYPTVNVPASQSALIKHPLLMALYIRQRLRNTVELLVPF